MAGPARVVLHEVVLLSERKAELVVCDPAALAEVRRIKIDQEAVLGQAPGDRNQGFEGIAFRPVPGQPGGGLFYLVHQRSPALLVALAFDPASGPDSLGGESVRQRVAFPGHQDLTAVTWDPSLDRLLVVADQQDRILVDGQPLKLAPAHVYIALYKPRGVLSTVSAPDPRPTVRDLVELAGHFYPVGRLDVDSEGLILLTDDGELANRLTHPR